ncbi:GDSL lipase/esterase [Dillenia turbinata]|uniref:GDSL lipase/esterase n=1 Tax=Dillenia turbinata TaxID=194707 RepID=A0AAN8ZCW2_9MAGN
MAKKINVVEGSRHGFDHSPQGRQGSNKRLFVFGDSYVDTGNTGKAFSPAWKAPYGSTFPGKPAGRFSDGRVLTDYLASFLGIRSPIPYRWRKYGKEVLKYGMNFGSGGTGVFDTIVPGPNMTTQINYFEQQVAEKVYTKQDLGNSIALASIAGNDYATFILLNGSSEPLQDFTRSVINQISVNLKRIHNLGVRKILVTSIEPLGCLPRIAAKFLYKKCSQIENSATTFHNQLLQQVVRDLNNATHQSAFRIIDLNYAFLSAMKKQNNHTGTVKFGDPLKPCCVGVAEGYSCGDVDENGVKKFAMCKHPMSAFFWDDVHPTQEGWHEVFLALQPSLNKLH